MIKKYIRKVIQESNIKQREKFLIDEMIRKSIQKLLSTDTSVTRFLYALKLAKIKNIKASASTSLYYNNLKYSEQETLKDNLTKEIVKHSEFFKRILTKEYNKILNRDAGFEAANEVGAIYGQPASNDMDSHTARGYGMIPQHVFDEHVRKRTAAAQNRIQHEADKFAKKYGLFE